MVIPDQKPASCPSQPQEQAPESESRHGALTRSPLKTCEAASLRTRKSVRQLVRPLTDTGWQAHF